MEDKIQRLFSHKEIAELLVKKEGLHEGIWGLVVELQFGAALAGTPELAFPTGYVGVSKIGIQSGTELNSVSVDAAVVNPRPKKTRGKQAP